MVKNKAFVENIDGELFNNVLNKSHKLKIKTTMSQKDKIITLLQKLFDYTEEGQLEGRIKINLYHFYSFWLYNVVSVMVFSKSYIRILGRIPFIL